MEYVSVLSSTGQPLMPCHAGRARELVRKKKAIRRFDRGIIYLQLTNRSAGETQRIGVGIDPGSKKEAITVKTNKRTLLNMQADAVTWVKEAEGTSTSMRRSRRNRKTPYRQMRTNRNQGQPLLPPSTKARWGWKLRLCTWLARYYPIHVFIVEDIQASTRQGTGRPWNQRFSPLEVGKDWFYYRLGRLAPVEIVSGHATAAERERLGLKKSPSKLSDKFEAHCLDSWTLANRCVGGHDSPDNTTMLYIVPLRFHRRQLHRLEPAPGNLRRPYGGTLSRRLKRGAWVKHPNYGVCYLGGTMAGRISLHSLQTGQRLTQTANPNDLTLLCTASWRIRKQTAHSSPG